MSDCLFCKISSSEFGTEFVFEDDECVVFNDIHPKAKTHLLIVPKKHIDSVATMKDGDEHVVGHLIHIAKIVAKKLNLKAYNLQINVGQEAGQSIFHIHLHLTTNYS